MGASRQSGLFSGQPLGPFDEVVLDRLAELREQADSEHQAQESWPPREGLLTQFRRLIARWARSCSRALKPTRDHGGDRVEPRRSLCREDDNLAECMSQEE